MSEKELKQKKEKASAASAKTAADAEKSKPAKDTKKETKPKKAKAKKLPADELIYEVIRRPIVTEKSQRAVEQNKVTFVVAKTSTKKQIKHAVSSLFGKKAVKVNVINRKGKTKFFRGNKGKRNDVKKAIITLEEGQTIDIESLAL